MPKVVTEVAIGAAMVAAPLVLPGVGIAISATLASALTSAGAGFVLSGIGTLLGQRSSGIATSSRNPISPWQVIYGRTKVGGVVVFQEETAHNNRILTMIVVAACHSCDAIEAVFFNNKQIPFKINSQFTDQSNPQGFRQSYTFSQFNCQIETISRTNDIVSVTFTQASNGIWAFNGQTVQIIDSRDAAGIKFDGYYPVVQTGPNSFTYTSGGAQGPGSGHPGTIKSTYPDYGGTVTVGYYLGNQTQASGILLGNTAGYWTEQHILKGRTYVAFKLIYDSTKYSGLPEISFVVRGKNDIYDPRTGKKGYSNNAALCIADYLAHPQWGYGAQYGTDIPLSQLIAAANICDEQVELALGGSEPRYQCDGAFDVSVKRGDVLQNLLTSCAGRLVYIGGQYIIQPAAWVNPVGAITVGGCSGAPKMMMSSAGLVPDFFNSPANSYVPGCAGTTKSQFVFALGMLQAYQASGNSNALAQAMRALTPIASILFRGTPIPDAVTATSIWSPNGAFDVKQAFLGDGGAIISVNQDFASDFKTPAGWRPLVAHEIQTRGDAYSDAIRLFGLAASVIDNTSSTVDPELGYGLSPYGATYGDPPGALTTINSQWILYLNAILKMAQIAYQVQFSRVSGSTLTITNPAFQGGAVPFAIEFTGQPTPALTDFIGPYYTGYQSPWAIRQVNPGNPAKVALAVSFLSQAQNQLAAQQTQSDTVTFTITGANAQSIMVPVEITPAGTAIAQLSYQGHAVGTDTIVATLPSHSLTSNQAKIAWSAYTKPIAVYGVQIAVMAADGSSLFNGLTAVLSTQSVQGLMFNTHPASIFPGDPHDSGNQAFPFVSNATNDLSQYAGDQPIQNTGGKFNAVITGGFTVNAAGNVSFSAYVNSRFVIGVQGATYVSGMQLFGALSGGTAQKGYTAQVGNNSGDWQGGNWAQVDFTLHFPAPGLYQFEIDYASGLFGERQFALKLQAGGIIPTVNLAAGTGTTATGTPPSGSIQLTPYSGGAAIGSNAVFVCSITGLTYSGPSAGPFAPVYYFQVPPGEQTWGVQDTWGFSGPDPNATSGYYQYRALAELCELIAICDGTESYYSQANTVANTFVAWINSNWGTAANGPPNSFPRTGAVRTTQDIHCAALILHAIMSLDLHARPNGTGSMNTNQFQLLNKFLGMAQALYLSSGPMAGTFCLDPSGAQTWSPIWHGELLRSLSMLVQWCNVNPGQASLKASVIVWINGLVDFALNNVVVVDPDLGYTVDDLSAPVKWSPKLPHDQLFNGIKGTFVSEANQWQQSDVPPYCQDQLHGYTNGTAANNYDANVDSDGVRLWADKQLPFTTSVSAAQRIFKIELMRIRQQGRGTVSGMLSMYNSQPLDIVFFSFAAFDWVNKLLEVSNVRLLQNKVNFNGVEAVVFSTELDLQESDPSVYLWDQTTEELSAQGYSYISGLQNLSPD